MKIIFVLLSWVLSLSCCNAMSDSLETLLKKLEGMEDGEFGYDERMIAAWPGLSDETALLEVVDEVLKPGRNENYPNEMDILNAMQFPREKIVGIILKKIENRNDYESGLNRAFGLLQDFTDDPRVFPYLIEYINDKRPMGRRERMVDADYGSAAARICDCAASVIRQGLEKRQLLKPGEPGWGQPGGDSTHEEADRSIAVLKQVLIKNGLMSEDQGEERIKKTPGAGESSSSNAGKSQLKTRESRRSQLGDRSENTGPPWLWMLGTAVIVVGAIIWLFSKQRVRKK